MQIAAPYTNDARWKNIPNEYNISYTNTGTLEKLISFCNAHLDKRINICFKDESIDFQVVKKAMEIHPDLAIRLKKQQVNFKVLELLHKNEIKFFFDVDSFSYYSLSMLKTLIDLKVSDIYIYDNFCYNMKDIKEVCEKNNIKTRLIINIIPTISPYKGDDICSPIYCPKDIDELEKYVDVIEFDCWKDDVFDWHYFNVLYKTWIKNKNWIGDLREINKELKIPLPHRSYPTGGFSRRFNCGRRCLFNSDCQHCQKILELTESFAEKGLIIKPHKGERL